MVRKPKEAEEAKEAPVRKQTYPAVPLVGLGGFKGLKREVPVARVWLDWAKAAGKDVQESNSGWPSDRPADVAEFQTLRCRPRWRT